MNCCLLKFVQNFFNFKNLIFFAKKKKKKSILANKSVLTRNQPGSKIPPSCTWIQFVSKSTLSYCVNYVIMRAAPVLLWSPSAASCSELRPRTVLIIDETNIDYCPCVWQIPSVDVSGVKAQDRCIPRQVFMSRLRCGRSALSPPSPRIIPDRRAAPVSATTPALFRNSPALPGRLGLRNTRPHTHTHKWQQHKHPHPDTTPPPPPPWALIPQQRY